MLSPFEVFFFFFFASNHKDQRRNYSFILYGSFPLFGKVIISLKAGNIKTTSLYTKIFSVQSSLLCLELRAFLVANFFFAQYLTIYYDLSQTKTHSVLYWNLCCAWGRSSPCNLREKNSTYGVSIIHIFLHIRNKDSTLASFRCYFAICQFCYFSCYGDR